MKSFSELREKKGDPCWKGYTQVGMKKKNGKEVPNCVPSDGVEKAKGYKKESTELEEWEKETPWRKVTKQRKDKYGNVIKTKNIAKHLAKSAQKQTAKESVDLDEAQIDEAKETTKLIKDLVQIVQDYHNIFSYEDDPNDEYYKAYKDALNQIEKIAGKKVRDQVDKEKPVKRMMSKSSTLDKAKSLRKYGTKKDGTANKNAIKKFKQDILNRVSKHTMAMKGKLPEEVELDEAKFKVGDEVMRTDKDNAPSGKIAKVLPGDKYLIKYTATKTVGDEKISAKDLYLLSGKKKKANEEVELDEAKGTGVKKFVKGMRVAKTSNPNMKGTVIKGGDNMKKGVEVEWDSGTTTVASGKYLTSISKNESIEEAYKTPAEAGAFEDGKKAARKGKKYEDNPHKKGTNLHLWWSKGHNKVRESVDLEEAKLSVGDRVTLKPNKNTLDQSLIGKAGVVTGMLGSKPTVKFANGKTIAVSPKDLKINESVELDEANKYNLSTKSYKSMEDWIQRTYDYRETVGKPPKKYDHKATYSKNTFFESGYILSAEEATIINNFLNSSKVPDQTKWEIQWLLDAKNMSDDSKRVLIQCLKTGNLKPFAKHMKRYNKKYNIESVQHTFFSLREARRDAAKDLYFDTYSAAVQAALADVKKKGFEVDEDDWHDSITTGPGKPGRGKTTRHTIDLVDVKTGKPSRKKLHIQVYNRETDKNTYELNYYVS